MVAEGVDRPDTSSGRKPLVVSVGKRRSARLAAKRLGLELLEIDAQTIEALTGVPWSDNPEATRAALQSLLPQSLLPVALPVAVIAVTEGTVPMAAAIREAFGLAGTSSETAYLCYNKVAMKRALAAAGVPCAPWREVKHATTVEELVADLGLPIVLKIPTSSGGRGVTFCHDAGAVARSLRPGLLAEGFIDGTEMSVESLLFDGAVVFRNSTCYLEPRWASIVPAELASDDQDAVEALADAVHSALGISHGMTHMELFLTTSGPVAGEIGARPPGGRLMELIERAYGFDPWRAVLETEIDTRPTLPQAATHSAGVWMLHPGKGKVAEVKGVEEARALPGVSHVRVTAKPGDQVPERVGTGQSIGEIICEASDHHSCASVLRRARALIDITLCTSGHRGVV